VFSNLLPGNDSALSRHVTMLYVPACYLETYQRMILLLGLYGCGTSSLTLRAKYRLWVFENRVLRRILGPKRK
jgi:hypothetical protein